MAWYGMVWFGLFGVVLYGQLRCGVIGRDRDYVVRPGVVSQGCLWCGVNFYMKGRKTLTKQEKVKALVELFISKSYGEMVEHYVIASTIHESYPSRNYSQIVSRAQKELRESGHMVTNVWKVGYQVVNPDDYTGESVRRIVRGVRQIDRGVQILENAPVKDMSQDGIQRYNTVRDRTCILQASMHGARVEIKMLNTKRKNPLLTAVTT